MRRFSLAIVLFSSVVGAATLDTSNSNLSWYGQKLTGFHYGSIRFKDGSLDVKSGSLTGGFFEVDMDSMTCGDCDKKNGEKLIGHLKSDDFFGVEKNKTATLKITKVTPWEQVEKKKQTELLKQVDTANKRDFSKIKIEKPTHLLIADLTIKGQTNSQEIVANVMNDAGSVTANGFMNIDRTRWNVRYGSNKFFDNLGDRVISDHFEVSVALKAK